MEWIRRLWYVVNRRKLERELQEEMDAHREMMRDPKDFGNTLRLREESRDIWGWNWIDDLQRDFIYAFRSLARTPFFTFASILMLAVGIGLNLTVFQLGSTFLLPPSGLKDIDSLVRFDRKADRFQTSEIPYEATQFIAAHGNVFSDVMSQKKTMALWGEDVRAQAVAFVSSNWFSGMGYGALQGRVLGQGIDDLSGIEPSIVISEWFWRRQLDGNPGIVGSVARINGRKATIVGVVRADSEGGSPSAPRVWMPIEQISYFMPGSDLQTRWDAGPELYARLKPGVSLPMTREALRPVMADLAAQHPEAIHQGEWLEPFTARTRFRDPAFAQGDQMFVLFLSVLTGITLLVACANLGNFMLSRNVSRMQEMRIRIALGASRINVMRHLLAESVVLAGIGCAGGVVVCSVALRVLLMSISNPLPLSLTLDWRTAIVTLAVGAFAAATVGLLPAWKFSRNHPGTVLRTGPYLSSSSFSQVRMRNVLVGLQIMCSCVLLVVGGLIVREMQRASAVPRIAVEKVAAMDVALDQFGIRRDAAREYWQTVSRVLSQSSVVDRVSLVESVPFGPTSEQRTFKDAPGLPVVSNRVDGDFFDLFGIALLAGRTFESGDDERTAVIISKRLAEKMYGRIDAVGEPFPKNRPTTTVIGVVADAQTMSTKDTGGAQRYVPLAPADFGSYHLVARARHDPRSLVPVLKAAAKAGDVKAVPAIHLLREDYALASRANRTVDLVIVAMAFIALTIASFGVFGVVSYSVALRQKEFGIRLAVGANRSAILGLVMADLLKPVIPAMLLGIGLSVLGGTILEKLVGMKTWEPLVLSAVVVLMFVTTGLAALFPTMRALRTNAINVLKWDS